MKGVHNTYTVWAFDTINSRGLDFLKNVSQKQLNHEETFAQAHQDVVEGIQQDGDVITNDTLARLFRARRMELGDIEVPKVISPKDIEAQDLIRELFRLRKALKADGDVDYFKLEEEASWYVRQFSRDHTESMARLLVNSFDLQRPSGKPKVFPIR